MANQSEKIIKQCDFHLNKCMHVCEYDVLYWGDLVIIFATIEKHRLDSS